MKTVTIAFANNKGGSGKSTTCANVGYALAEAGKRVLLVDGDMQMNLTLSFVDEETALDYAKNGRNLYSAIKEQKPLGDMVTETPYPGLSLIPSSTLMSGIEYDLFTRWQREFILKKALEPLKSSGAYDFILIDSPPTLGGWVMNILCASDYAVVPVEASPWGVFGLANMIDFVNEVRTMTSNLSVLGIAVTKADERKNYFKETLENLHAQKTFPLFSTVIHTDSAVEWAQDRSVPIAVYKKSARSSKEYAALAKEISENASR